MRPAHTRTVSRWRRAWWSRKRRKSPKPCSPPDRFRSMEPDPLSQAFEQFRLGRYDVAERHCRIVLERNPDHAEINHLLGAIRYRQGNLEEALVLLKRATISPGATAEHHNDLGCMLLKLGQKDAASAAFERALAIKPGYADALNNLGIIYRERSKGATAV